MAQGEVVCGKLVQYSPEFFVRVWEGSRRRGMRNDATLHKRILDAIAVLMKERKPLVAKAVGYQAGDLCGVYRYLRKHPGFAETHGIAKRSYCKRRQH
jgi:hypothetical protein